MKKVITNESVDSIHIDKITPDMYFGVLQGEKHKGFIARAKWDEGPYIVYSKEMITNGNQWDSWVHSDITSLVRALPQSFVVYAFNTPDELFQWLSS